MHRKIIAFTLLMLLLSVVLALGQGTTPTTSAPPLMLTVSNRSCAMALAEPEEATPEATAEAEATEVAVSAADYPVLTLGNDCADVIPLLYAPTNGTLWVSLWLPDEFPWQQFRTVAGDEHPPKFDTRGRFVGCANPEKGEHTCQALWDYEDVTYRIELPMLVGNAYTPSATSVPASTDIPTSAPEPENNGVWGNCGSCTTCGGPVEHCVLSPDNQCLWDAYRCERPNPPTSVPSGGGGEVGGDGTG